MGIHRVNTYNDDSHHFITANLSPYIRKTEAIGNGWNAMGLQNAKAGHWEAAVLCWENALEIRLQIFGEYHPDVANTLNNMGIAWGKMQEYDLAMESLYRTLEIRTLIHCGGSSKKDNNGSAYHHLDIAATLFNIGSIAQQMKEYETALACFDRVKETQLILKEDLLVARTSAAMGRLHLENRDVDNALESHKDAILYYVKAGYASGDEEYDIVLQTFHEAQRHANAASA